MASTAETLNGEYRPAKASARAEQATLRSRITEVEQKLRTARSKVAIGDTQFVRLVQRYESEVQSATEKLHDFNSRSAAEEKQAGSSEADKARKYFNQVVRAWEISLNTLAADSRTLLDAASAYADASGIRDSARFPHRHIVMPDITRRAHRVLTDCGLKFDQYAPSAPIGSLTDKWRIE